MESELPFVSIIVPVYNEAEFIPGLIQSFLIQDYPSSKMEMIVVDGNSSDRTAEIVRRQSLQNNNIHLIANPERMTFSSLNKGIFEAKGEIIVRWDGHAEYNSEYVREAVKCMKDEDVIVCGGYWDVNPSNPDNIFQKIIAKVFRTQIVSGFSKYRINGLNKPLKRTMDTVPYGVFRKKQLVDVGMFHPIKRGQDIELYDRIIRKYKGTILGCPNMRIAYKMKEKNTKDLFNRYYKQGECVFLRNYGIRVRHVLPLFMLLTSLPFLFVCPWDIFLIMPLMYSIICLFFFFLEIDSLNELTYTPYALSCFVSIHAGYLLGLIRSATGRLLMFFSREKRIREVRSLEQRK